MKINAQWHRGHVMPKNPSPDQMLAWPIEHQKNCACRPIPPGFLEKIKKGK